MRTKVSMHVETVVLLSHKKTDSTIKIKVEFGQGEGKVSLDNIAKRAEAYKTKERVTYKMIKEYIEAKYGFKVHTAYIAEVKRRLGLLKELLKQMTQDFGKGFTVANLKNMRQFYLTFPNGYALRSELSWTH